MKKIDVLDHGYVRLINHMGSDLAIVRNARVSHDAAWREGIDEGSDKRLLKYLIENEHTSPLEAVEFQFEIKCPMFVARQWHRHRTWSYNEVSGRYSVLPTEFYVPEPSQIKGQAKGNKQQRAGEPIEHADAAALLMRKQCEYAFATYEELLNRGVARELARSVLPASTYTHFFAKVDLKNLLHFIHLRDHSHAQHEIRVYAQAIRSLIEPIIPVTYDLWDKHHRQQTDMPRLMDEAISRAEQLQKELMVYKLTEGPNQVVDRRCL